MELGMDKQKADELVGKIYYRTDYQNAPAGKRGDHANFSPALWRK